MSAPRAVAQNGLMRDLEPYRRTLAPSRSITSVVSALLIDEFDHDGQRVALPSPEIQLVFRFGPSMREGLDAYALGLHHTARRKYIPRGQRAVTVRLRLGAAKYVLGVPASMVAGTVRPLEYFWGVTRVGRLLDQLAEAKGPLDAVKTIETSIATRLATVGPPVIESLARDAAERLISANVSTVARGLGVSERQLRRVFRETTGMSPKWFARLARFRETLRIARQQRGLCWADIAVAAGYFDQAHLISEFHAIAGASPRALLCELDADHVAPRDTLHRIRDMRIQTGRGKHRNCGRLISQPGGAGRSPGVGRPDDGLDGRSLDRVVYQ